MRRSGCLGLILGLESRKQDTLSESGKKFVKADTYEWRIRKIQSYGISLWGAFIFGWSGKSGDHWRASRLPSVNPREYLDRQFVSTAVVADRTDKRKTSTKATRVVAVMNAAADQPVGGTHHSCAVGTGGWLWAALRP
jgi:hypothetical protein